MDESKKMGYRSTGIGGVTSGASTRTPYSAMDLHTTTPRRMYPSSSSDGARMKTEDAGLSARGILIRRKLTERKRFDSADYAMKNAGNRSNETEEMKWKGTNQGKIGASVFLNALNDGDVEMTSYENEAVSTSTTIPYPLANTNTKYRNYGTLSTPSGSGHSVLIQKKLQDRRQFDSADYQLARQRPVGPSERSPSPLPMETSEGEEMNLSSPSASTTRDFAYTQMSPSSTVRTTNMNKYAGLSGASEVARRRIAEKKRFDSADEFMAVPNVKPMTQAERFLQRQQTGGNTSPQRGVNEYSLRNAAYPTTPTLSGVTPPPAPSQVEATASPGGSKYGKLCAANVLIRKKLKERKRFDSADYNMERAAAEGKEQDHVESQPSVVFTPTTTQWTSTTAPQPNAVKRIDESKPVVNNVSSQESRLMARNVLLHKKLAERKRFDSADFFSAQEAAKRGHLAA